MTTTGTYAMTHVPLPKDSPTLKELTDMIREETEKCLKVPLHIMDYEYSIPNKNGLLMGNHENLSSEYMQKIRRIIEETGPRSPRYPYRSLASSEYEIMLDLAIEIISACPEPVDSNGRCAISLEGGEYYIAFGTRPPRPNTRGQVESLAMVLEFGKVNRKTNNVALITVISGDQDGSVPLKHRIAEAFAFREDDPEFPAIERIGLFFDKYEEFVYDKERDTRTENMFWNPEDIAENIPRELTKLKNRPYTSKQLYYMQPLNHNARIASISNV